MKNTFRFLQLLACGFALSTTLSHAQTTYNWTGSAGDGNWDTAGNWAPTPDHVIGTFESGVYDTRVDSVVIDGPHNVNRTGSIIFNPAGNSSKAITLLNGANLTASTSIQVYATSGAGNARSVEVGSGSSLTAETIATGTSNNSSNKVTWDIYGALNATTFNGRQGSTANNANQPSGYILNVNGGSMAISGTFNWKNLGYEPNLARVGQINISNGGIVNIGTMASDWVTTEWGNDPNNVVTFVDGSGSLKFGHTNWSDSSSVQALIDNNYIRIGSGVGGNLNIMDAGDSWVITVIPESSTTVAAFGIAILSAVIALRKRRNA